MKLRTILKDNYVFLREFFKEFQSTGTLCPTSRWAAEALTLPMRNGPMRNGSSDISHNGGHSHNGHAVETHPRSILEIGPGTGSVTFKILELMQDSDHFTICEINPRFLEILKHKLEKSPYFQKHRERVYFFQGPIQDLPENQKFDIIICALPFLNFDLDMVRDIFSKLQRLSSEAATMTYYEYIGLRSLGLVAPPTDRRKRFRQLDSFFSELFNQHLSDRKQVWLNVLPVNIYKLRNIDALQEARSNN